MSKLKIGITIGDINGIGMEVILKTLSDERIAEICTPIIYGSAKLIGYHKTILTDLPELKYHQIKDGAGAQAGVVNLINCWQENVDITPGLVTEDGGKYAALALDAATADLMAGRIDAVVTAPIHKKAMELSGFGFTGHTEYFTAKTGARDHMMMMVSDLLRVGLVTGHIPVSEIAKAVTKDQILRKITLMNATLRRDFAVVKPKIAVLGINPHASDEGAIGQEDLQHTVPAIAQARKNGILAFGPFPADGFFGAAKYKGYDGIVAMYHDQGLTAFKLLSFHDGVNYTAGLPVVRTSPDHGTAFDIVGQNIADPDSFRRAFFMAMDIARNRRTFKEDYANPLKKQEIDDPDLRSNEPDGVVLDDNHR